MPGVRHAVGPVLKEGARKAEGPQSSPKPSQPLLSSTRKEQGDSPRSVPCSGSVRYTRRTERSLPSDMGMAGWGGV